MNHKKGVCSLKTNHPAQVLELTYRWASSIAEVLTLVDLYVSRGGFIGAEAICISLLATIANRANIPFSFQKLAL